MEAVFICQIVLLLSSPAAEAAYLTELYVAGDLQYFNDIPDTIFYGLHNRESSEQTSVLRLNISAAPGTCLQYDPQTFYRCDYYSDCCPFVPARKHQLPKGTFSCHDEFYVVDSCPASTSRNLRDLCSTEHHSSGE
jgi:hypothetical protein